MQWNYNGVIIVVNQDGEFCFNFNGTNYKEDTLVKAKGRVDDLTIYYYLFTQSDMDRLLSKLDVREQELVRSLCHEIAEHRKSSYCQAGIIEDDWTWDFDMED